MGALFLNIWRAFLRRLARVRGYVREHRRRVIVGVAMCVVLFALIGWAAYARRAGLVWADWTGFGEYKGTVAKDDRGKFLWDWMELLIIPIVLAGGALFFNWQERENERRIAGERRKNDIELAENRTQEEALQSYFDKIGELILDKHLMEIKNIRYEAIKENILIDENGLDQILTDDQRSTLILARIRTVTLIRRLETDRINNVLQFLSDADLASFILVFAPLNDTDLSNTFFYFCNLSYANFGGADLTYALFREVNLESASFHKAKLYGAVLVSCNLREVSFGDSDLRMATLQFSKLENSYFSKAIMQGIDLSFCYLKGAKMWNADLTGADLKFADLSGADLSGSNLASADLTGSNISNVDLSKANLLGAIVSKHQLETALSLEEAIMPDGKKFDPAIHTFWKRSPASKTE